MAGRIPEPGPRLVDIGQRVTHVARSEVAIARLHVAQLREAGRECIADGREEGVERGALADGDVVNLIDGGRIGHGRGQEVGLHGVVDVAEVTAGLAIAVDEDVRAAEEGGSPGGDDGGIGAGGILTRAEDVEVAQADAAQAVGAGEDIGVELVDDFGDGVGRERFADAVFLLGQAGVIAVGGAAGGVNEARDALVAGGDQHVEKAVDVGGVGGDGVFQGAGDGTQGGLVEHQINAGAGLTAVIKLADVAKHKVKA